MPPLAFVALCVTSGGRLSQAYGQAGAANPSSPAVGSLAPGTPLGGEGRRTLGGLGAVRVGDLPRPASAPLPAPTPVPPGPFRTLADAIDSAADPS